MIIYKCDKCGERVYKANMVTMSIEKRDMDDIIVDTYHYCPECFRKFLDWVDEEDD